MLHPATLAQFEKLKRRNCGVALDELPSGAALVTIPDFRLPPGWLAETTTVWFIVPVGYPGPFPDCFWATATLRLSGGQLPQATNLNTIPETAIQALWFSWHIVDQGANWNPNRDDLNTYVGIIAERFRKIQ
jgi:hypothetical protein